MSYVKFLKALQYNFIKPPLIVGGHAMEYYNVRKAGHDLDIMVSLNDWEVLKKKYPNTLNLFGGQTEDDVDATLNLEHEEIDIIKTLWLHDYNELMEGSIDLGDVKVISLSNLLYIKAFPSITHNDNKSTEDVKSIIKKVIDNKKT
tara:strand:- start:4580 stop:5017 length:438 start_codon:yes stop_codon:yes gene_type:complete